jgi:hypothetical protein
MPEIFETAFMVVQRDDLFWIVSFSFIAIGGFVMRLFSQLGKLLSGYAVLSERQILIAESLSKAKESQNEATRATRSMARLIHWDATQRAIQAGHAPPPPLDLD